jgi:GNAT superfamily N-acetyltransferase
MPLHIAPLTPARLPDWLAFFDHTAFADNPEWGTCYCRVFHIGGGGHEAWDRACSAPGENRAAMSAKILAGEVDGLLAYRDGAVAGWTQFGPTSRFHPPLGPLGPAEDGVASIVCFLVAPAHRRTGVSRALLRAAIERLTKLGFWAVDARPAVEPDGVADMFTGPLGLYASEGFAPHETVRGRVRMRRVLAG